MKQKTQNKFVYNGLGFPIILINVPMIEVMGVWTPNINYDKLQKIILHALSQKPIPLTGNEVKFLRQYLEMNMEDFGKIFGVTHAAVSKWEQSGNEIAKIAPATEKCMRLFILDNLKIKDKEFRHFFREIDINKLAEQRHIKLRKEDTAPFSFDAARDLVTA